MQKDYEYKMRYVPRMEEMLPADIIKESTEDFSVGISDNINSAALGAIESMLAMCAMVYMKCMESMRENI